MSRLEVQLYNARKRGLPATLTWQQWQEIQKHFNWQCAYCQKKWGRTIEHFIPLDQGGGTTANNCVPACQSCNVLKGDRHPDIITDKRLLPGIVRVHAYLREVLL